MTTIKLSDLLDEFEFGSVGYDTCVYLSLERGTFHPTSGELELEEEPPQDLDDATKYIAIPHKNDLDLGRSLALSFVEEVLPDDYDTAVAYFRKRGAYARFKGLLEARGMLNRWYEYESTATKAALCQWCKDNDIDLV